ncbi:MAG: ATP synthase subunit I [Lachnospiraceae bacterium]|nr:ATP synthase subunit I [Lachnospiraceae bacterium]
MSMKKKIDPTLFDLCLGIFLYGIVFQIVLLLFSREVSYSLGLWIGVVLAAAGSVHMWWSLDRGMDQASKQAAKTIGTNNLIRYFVLVVVMFVLIYTDFANPIFMFCGYMGMKISAYLNPWLRKISEKVFKI